MVRNEGDMLRRVVLCSPRREYCRVADPRSHNIHEIADRQTSLEQHRQLRDVLAGAGAEVVDVPELPDHPNSVFTRDTSLVTPQGYIQLRMGLDTRRGEGTWMSRHLEAMGVPQVGRIDAPGTVEGGDVILAGSVAFVGQSERTNEAGVSQLARFLLPMGFEVRVARIEPPRLHIGGAMSMVGAERVLCCAGLFPHDYFEGFDVIAIPGGTFISGNVICVAPDEVIAETSNVRAISALEQAGVTVRVLDLSEFVKGAGGPSCLILPVERDGVACRRSGT
jgi:dimethylargininase